MPDYPIYGSKPFLANLNNIVSMLSNSKMTLLIAGETGTGKSYLGKHIASKTAKYSGKHTILSVGSLPSELIESELFGYSKGSFTGAVNNFEGRIMAANQGTVILDDISCLPVHLQAKLLRLLDDCEFERLGDATTYKADVRFIVTSNDDLPAMVKRKQFRKDLYYRINSFILPLKPLRHKDRESDIGILGKHFAKHYGQETGRGTMGLSRPALEAMKNYSWPGNVRELQREMECAVNKCMNKEKNIGIQHLSDRIVVGKSELDDVRPSQDSMSGYKRELIIDALRQSGGKKKIAADNLRVSRRTLYNWIKKYDIDPDDIF